MNKKTTISFVLGAAISVAALYISFRNVPIDDLLKYFSSINYWWAIPAGLVGLSTFIFRALRWQAILKPVRKISFMQSFHPVMISFMINSILPGRIGEAVRPAILLKNEKIPFSTGLATVAVDRLFDIVYMFLLFSVIMANITIDPDFVVDFGGYHLNKEVLSLAGKNMIGIGIIVILGIFLLIFEKTRNIINYLISKLPVIFFLAGASFKKRIEDKLCLPAQKILKNFSDGFLLIKSPKTIFICICYTIIIWLLCALSYYLLSFGCPRINISFTGFTAVMIIVCFFIAIPSAPGYWGLWEAGGIFAMALFGVSAKDAAGYTLINHVIQMLPVIVTGLVSATLTGITIRKVSSINHEG
ncbi:MAG: flippase-like domain-containing protein [Proteobacteria bacterium]|nr:flippase-like domain-containing protein [Pseudomonadota bacterium]